ncbi:MAG: OsmC family protein [Bacteroidales bacterium]|nr:OsmC family protein [Bacteroidales bacterium]MBN2819555.1 OsmC family protein [Bacteroidales bacterium]
MKDSINVKWTDGMSFETEIDGYKISVDAKEEFGGQGKGPRPKPLMMMALAGCTGMDVVSILNKMRVNFDDFNVIVDAELTDEHPKHYRKMHLIYKFKGENLPLDKIEKAITLSQENYCGVSASYKKAMEITYEIKIN